MHNIAPLFQPAAASIDNLAQFIAHIQAIAPLLDSMHNVVFFIKNPQAQYVWVNQTLLLRSGLQDKSQLIGLTAEKVFTGNQGGEYTAQDLSVLSGSQIKNKLELHNYLSGKQGWCITQKIPLYNQQNEVIGIAGVSIDIDKDNSDRLRRHKRLAMAVAYIRAHLEHKITVVDLAQHASCSVSQLERLFKEVLHISPMQMVQKMRLEWALDLLQNTQEPIVGVAIKCGYTDHSAFTRQFKQFTGLSPSAYRNNNKAA